MKITWIILLSMCLSTLSSASVGGVMPSSCANPGANSRKVFNVKKLLAMKQLITKKIAPGLLSIQKYNPSGQLGKQLKPQRQAFSKNQIQKKLLAPLTFLIAVQQDKKKTSSANFEKALRVFIQNVDAYMAKISTYQQLTKSVRNSKLQNLVKITSEQTLRLAKKLHSDYQKPLGAYGTPSMYLATGISTQHMGGPMMPNTATRPMVWPQQGVYTPFGMMPGRGNQVVGFGTQPYSMQPGVVQGTIGNQQNIDQSRPTQSGNLASAGKCPCVGQKGAQALSANTTNSQGLNLGGSAVGAVNTANSQGANLGRGGAGALNTANSQGANLGRGGVGVVNTANSQGANLGGSAVGVVNTANSQGANLGGSGVGAVNTTNSQGANLGGSGVGVVNTANSQGANLGGSGVGAVNTNTKVADKELLAAEQSAAQLAVEAAKAAEIVLEMAKQSAEESAVVAETALENADLHVTNTTQEAEKKQQKAEELEIAAQNARNAIPPSATGAIISEDGIIKIHSKLSGADTKSSLVNSTSSSQENLEGTKVIYVDANQSVLIKSSANQVLTTTDVTTPTPPDISQQQSVTKPESSASEALSELNSFSQSQINSISIPTPAA